MEPIAIQLSYPLPKPQVISRQDLFAFICAKIMHERKNTRHDSPQQHPSLFGWNTIRGNAVCKLDRRKLEFFLCLLHDRFVEA